MISGERKLRYVSEYLDDWKRFIGDYVPDEFEFKDLSTSPYFTHDHDNDELVDSLVDAGLISPKTAQTLKYDFR